MVNSSFLRESQKLFGQNRYTKEREGLGVVETKVTTPGIIVPCKSCLKNLTDKAVLGKMCGVNVTLVDDVDKGQRHVITLVWSFKFITQGLRPGCPIETKTTC